MTRALSNFMVELLNNHNDTMPRSPQRKVVIVIDNARLTECHHTTNSLSHSKRHATSHLASRWCSQTIPDTSMQMPSSPRSTIERMESVVEAREFLVAPPVSKNTDVPSLFSKNICCRIESTPVNPTDSSASVHVLPTNSSTLAAPRCPQRIVSPQCGSESRKSSTR